jgi:Flp pilus assembly protein TadG
MGTSIEGNKTGEAGRKRGFFARFYRDRSGTTAIEFAMLAIPFSLLVFAILESCVSFAGQQVLANAADDVARQFRTGKERPREELTLDKLEEMVCGHIEIMVAKGCPGLKVDLRHYDSFAEMAKDGFQIYDEQIALTKGGLPDPQGFSVDPGLAQSRNMLRVFYEWPVMTDFMRASMSNLAGGKTLHFAAAVWQNEPFND